MPSSNVTRRCLLGTVATAVTGTLAGCSGVLSGGTDCTSSVVDSGDGGVVRGVDVRPADGDAVLTVRLDAADVEDGSVEYLSVYDFDRRETTIPLTDGGESATDEDVVAYRTTLGDVPRHGRYQVVALRSSGLSPFVTTPVDRVVFDFHCTRSD
jgi:hypothetical protein